MSVEKVPYDGPKNFEQIVQYISQELGRDPALVRTLIIRFLNIGIFYPARNGEKYTLRGVGSFAPWKITKLYKKKGLPLIKHNVDGTTVTHNRIKYKALRNRSIQKRKERESIEAEIKAAEEQRKILLSGWEEM